jgi:Photosynthesis system II assembly factor YCF48
MWGVVGRHLVRFYLTLFAQLLLVVSFSFSQDLTGSAHHVARTIPVGSAGYELSAERPPVPSLRRAEPSAARDAPQGNKWQLLATLPGVIHDIAFITAKIGYAVGEQGEVFKTTDGGTNWTQLELSDAGNDYFYGVAVLTAEKVIITGFYDASSSYGVFRWSEDGGRTWTKDMSPGPQWLQQVRFVKGENGIIMPLVATGPSNTKAEYTTDGGATLSNWKKSIADPSGAWFDPQFSMLTDLHARASGIHFCTSLTGGSKWSCSGSVDPVFDGPVFFLNDNFGWVGGGEIAPNVEGWLHATTDGGKTWTDRTLDGPWPIRSILFLNRKTGWAGGGNIYTNVGGIYFSADGGSTWSVDVTTNSEMGSCAKHGISGGHYRVWCAGFNYNGGFASVIYSTQY